MNSPSSRRTRRTRARARSRSRSRIIGSIEQPFDLGGHQVGVGTSIGIAFAPEHGADAESLLQKADLALYAAKSGGRNDFRIFKPELTEAADMQQSMESELRDAIARDEFELHYQPVVDAGPAPSAASRRLCAGIIRRRVCSRPISSCRSRN